MITDKRLHLTEKENLATNLEACWLFCFFGLQVQLKFLSVFLSLELDDKWDIIRKYFTYGRSN